MGGGSFPPLRGGPVPPLVTGPCDSPGKKAHHQSPTTNQRVVVVGNWWLLLATAAQKNEAGPLPILRLCSSVSQARASSTTTQDPRARGPSVARARRIIYHDGRRTRWRDARFETETRAATRPCKGNARCRRPSPLGRASCGCILPAAANSSSNANIINARTDVATTRSPQCVGINSLPSTVWPHIVYADALCTNKALMA